MSRSAFHVLREARSSNVPYFTQDPRSRGSGRCLGLPGETCLQEIFQRVFPHHCGVKIFQFFVDASDSNEEVL